MQVYLCSSCGFSILVRLWFSSLLLHENSAGTAALTGSVVGNVKTSSKASSFPHHRLKCCLAITKRVAANFPGGSSKRRAQYVHAVSLIAQPGLCYCFPRGRQGNLQAAAVFQISQLRQMLWVTLELWLPEAITTLNSGFQLSSDTSARWRGEERAHGLPVSKEQQVCTCSVQSTHGKHLNCVFISTVNSWAVPTWEEGEREEVFVPERVLGAAQKGVSVQESFAVTSV